MLRTPSIFGSLNSGFVPVSSAAPVDALADSTLAADALADDAIAAESAIAEVEAAEVVARAAAPGIEAPLREPVVPWVPASSASIRLVEAAVVAAVCGYFAWGLLRAWTGW